MRCPSCGQENPDGFRLCGMCGGPLDHHALERRERRVVSVVMADLQGFTSRSERLDVEDVDAFLAPYRATLRQAVERTGGVVSDFAGDGMMAVFGAPVAHEDDPERAVRAAIAIRDSILDPASPAAASGLHVRLGVTTGEVLVTLTGEQVRATGDVVNTAARLEAAAPTDGVLVDEWTYRATSRAIRYRPAEAVVAKGKADPVPAWLAVDPVSVLPQQARQQPALVGRDAEADALRGALDRSRGEPSTQLVSLIGEPGIGKSRLVEELFAHIDELPELITCRRGRSLAYGEGVAFWALGEMVKAEAGILESDSAGAARQKLAAAAGHVIVDDRECEWVVRHLGPLVGLEAAAGGGGRMEAFAAWRRFVEAMAERRPTVLVFEDIHWADDALLDFIDALADRAGAVPLLIVCTARPELFERRKSWGGGKGNAATMSLTPLSAGDTARLVGGLLGQALLPAEVQQPLLERAEGNPLYAQEYVRMLQDRGILVSAAGGWELSGDVVELPESLQGIIAARLDTLTAPEKELIHDASVVGRTAWIGAVCALTERSEWDAEELLHGLERKQLVHRVRRSSIQGETEFQFGHALTRDVAYGQIRRPDRAQKHEATARWIEQLAGEREDKAELLADHYAQALTLREQLGEDTGEITPRARVALTEAAEQAAAVSAFAAAARHYHAAVRLTQADDPARPALLLGEARARYGADALDPEFLGEVIEAQVAAEDWEAAADAERMLANWYRTHAGDGEAFDSHLATAAGYAARIPPSEVSCHIASLQAFRLVTNGRPAEALALTDAMIPIAERAGLDRGRARLLEWRGFARTSCGDGTGIEDSWTAAEIFAGHADPRTAIVYANLADMLRALGDLAAAGAALDAGYPWASRYDDAFVVDRIVGSRAYQAYHDADWVTALELAAQAKTSNPVTDVYRRVLLGRIRLARGEARAAHDDARAITEYATTSQHEEYLYEGLALEALIHNSADDSDAAQAVCSRFLASWHEHQGMLSCVINLCELSPALVDLGRHEDLRGAALLLPEACRWREPLLLTADSSYTESASRYAEIGSRPLAADGHLLAARQAAEQGRGADAATHAGAVLAFARQTGATLYECQAEQLVAATA